MAEVALLVYSSLNNQKTDHVKQAILPLGPFLGYLGDRLHRNRQAFPGTLLSVHQGTDYMHRNSQATNSITCNWFHWLLYTSD